MVIATWQESPFYKARLRRAEGMAVGEEDGGAVSGVQDVPSLEKCEPLSNA